MKVAVVGTGYVGLVTGTCLAETGNAVTCVDIKPEVVDALNNGRIHIYEPGLEDLVRRNRAAGRLSFTGDLAAAVRGARLIFVAVPTPELPSGQVGMQFVNKVVDDVAALFKDRSASAPVLVLKSTVPPGTNRAVTDRLAALGCAHIAVASNPEFLKEGAALDDFMTPDRVVVGTRSPAVADVLRELYAPYTTIDRPFLDMAPESAEMTKYAANAMLATKISFINEIANLCDATGADVNRVREGIGHDQRIGFQFLAPGPGYGGSCFAPDETVFVVEEGAVRAVALRALFDRVAQRTGARAAVAVGGPDETGDEGTAAVPSAEEPVRVLAWDLARGRAVMSDVYVLTRRPFRGTMMNIATTMGRRLRVTDDHPVIVWTEDGTETIPAADVRPGHRLAALHGLPKLDGSTPLDLTDLAHGAFSDDGAVTALQAGKNLMYEYATVSKRLADGMALLLQSLGVVVSIRRRMMNKSTMPAYILRVAGHTQLTLLRDAFGDKHRESIRTVLDNYERHIKPHGYEHTQGTAEVEFGLVGWGVPGGFPQSFPPGTLHPTSPNPTSAVPCERARDVSLLTVRTAEPEPVESQVYSLETSHGTVIASSGLVCHNCFPKDVKGLIAVARRLGLTFRVAEAVDAANEVQKEVLFAKINRHFRGHLSGRTFALWGLAFKPKTDDIREAPALTLIDALLAAGAKVRAFDPEAGRNVQKLYKDVPGDVLSYAPDPLSALDGADALVLVTEWAEFRNPDFAEVKRRLREPVIFDGRNLFAAHESVVRELGFRYYAVGRGDR